MARGLKAARNPSSILNEQHNDATGALRSGEGEILAISTILSSSSSVATIPNKATLRVCNTDEAVQYIWAGKQSDAPDTVDATTGIALPVGYCKMIYVEASDDDQQSMAVKTSDDDVQVVIMKD